MKNKKNLYNDSMNEFLNEDIDPADEILNNHHFESKRVQKEKSSKRVKDDKKNTNKNNDENSTIELEFIDGPILDKKSKRINIYLKKSDVKLYEQIIELCSKKRIKQPKKIDIFSIGLKKFIEKLEDIKDDKN